MTTDQLNLVPLTIILPVLYAEIHYRFKYFFSLLNKKEPEIIADIPSRCLAGGKLPVLITIKDAHRYPVTIRKVEIFTRDISSAVFEINQSINTKFYDRIFELPTDSWKTGVQYLSIEITYMVDRKTKKCLNDNYRFTSHKALPVTISRTPLPRLAGCIYGDPHTHSNYTSDQVEFGASLTATSRLAKCLELDFFCVTDHSYDLDDHPDDYLQNDLDLTKWNALLKETENLNRSSDKFFIIAGEEVTLRNNLDKNIHCLVLNNKKFYPGSGDSGERWFRTRSELSLPDLLDDTQIENLLIFAAHPAEKPPFLQRLLIGRDHWRIADCTHSGLNGLQFLNGGSSDSLKTGKKFWRSLLLKGYRLTGLSGNDSHGSFARSRQIRMPFISMREDYYHLFGNWRTGVYIDTGNNHYDQCLQNIRNGNCFMTNGPAMQFTSGECAMGGIVDRLDTLSLEALSSPEFGALSSIHIYHGEYKTGTEQCIYIKKISTEVFHYHETIKPPANGPGYVRCEVYTSTGHQALSNPIWINNQKSGVRNQKSGNRIDV